MKLTRCPVIFTVLISISHPVTGDEVKDLCDSVPHITIQTMDGMDKNGAATFVENNRSLMNLEILWLEDDAPASCARMVVTEIRKVKNEDDGKVEVGYFRGESEIWDFSTNETSGKGRIKDGKLLVTWSYGRIEVTQTDDGALEALWEGGKRALVPGRKKGRIVQVHDPLQ